MQRAAICPGFKQEFKVVLFKWVIKFIISGKIEYNFKFYIITKKPDSCRKMKIADLRSERLCTAIDAWAGSYKHHRSAFVHVIEGNKTRSSAYVTATYLVLFYHSKPSGQCICDILFLLISHIKD